MVFRVDKTEKQRLTNRFDGWRDNVHYIYRKHRSLIKKLPISIQVDFLLLYMGEAAMRSRAAGKTITYLWYRNVKRLINGPRKLLKKLNRK